MTDDQLSRLNKEWVKLTGVYKDDLLDHQFNESARHTGGFIMLALRYKDGARGRASLALKTFNHAAYAILPHRSYILSHKDSWLVLYMYGT